jgi:Na+-transporting NADH:ubiquinone oxidoreductase subunit F
MLNIDPIFQHIIIGVAVFLIVILLFVGLLLYARKKLTPEGNVKLILNGENELEVEPGSTLLATLANQKIFLPSACGGGGTCGVCRCQVLEGAGDILPTETGLFTRREQQNHWRLGCQVKVRGDLKIHVPEEVFGVKKWECEVVSNRNVATYLKEFVVKLPEGERLNFASGGYVQIDVPPCEVDYGKDIFVEEKFRGDWDNFRMWDL